MNRERILEVYFKSRGGHPAMPALAGEFGALFCAEANSPALFDPPGLEDSEDEKSGENFGRHGGNFTGRGEGSQAPSAYSRLALDADRLADILANRKKHVPFAAENNYFLIDSKGETVGPYRGSKMNDLFVLEALNESSMIRDVEESDFRPLRAHIKRYYKSLASREQNLERKVAPPAKKSDAKRLLFELAANPSAFARPTRVLSEAPKPSLFFYTQNDTADEPEEEVFVSTRVRSNTCAHR